MKQEEWAGMPLLSIFSKRGFTYSAIGKGPPPPEFSYQRQQI
jgi:hypothetical protein